MPIVGKEQVLRGREMHWMRIDRYFSAEKYDQAEIPEDVQVSFMGMMCQHCENAPCEQVCPVNATVHDSQGLNTMAYNRCVGTRYCANNCPYKVRRFNFFDWNKRKIGEHYKGPFGAVDEPELEKMRANPNVTVRMRGVMEKCTFCIQRTRKGENPACVDACPTGARIFGNLLDPTSDIRYILANKKVFRLKESLGTDPKFWYYQD